MNYADFVANSDVVLAAWRDGHASEASTAVALEHVLAEIRLGTDLKSRKWLAPQLERTIAILTGANKKGVAA